MVNDRIGPAPAPSISNKGSWCIEGNAQGFTYDGTLCTGEVFEVSNVGVCSRWDGSTRFARGVALQVPNLVDANGVPVKLGGAPADGQPMTFCEFGIVGIKTTCTDDDIDKGTPFKGAANGQVQNASATDATSVDKMVAQLLDFQAKNSAGGAFHWFLWWGYVTNTNDLHA